MPDLRPSGLVPGAGLAALPGGPPAKLTPIRLVLLTVFIDLIGFGIVLPLLPSYASLFQASDFAIGLLVASFSLMQFLLAPWWGRLSDRIGRRPVLLIGLSGSAASYLLFAVARSYWILLASRMIAGAMGATVTVAQAYLADVSEPKDRARSMGMLGAAFGLGFVVGPALAGIASSFGLAAPGIVAAAVTSANLLLAWRWLPETRGKGVQATRRGPAPHWSRASMGFAAMGLSTLGFTVLYVVFPLELERQVGLARHQSAYFFVLLGLVSATVQGLLIGRLVERFGERRLIAAGSWLLALGFLAMPAAFAAGTSALVAIGVGMVAVAAGSGVISPSATAYVSRMAPAEEQGQTLGLLISVGAVARIAGPIMAGALATAGGARLAFYGATACAALAGMSPMVFREKE